MLLKITCNMATGRTESREQAKRGGKSTDYKWDYEQDWKQDSQVDEEREQINSKISIVVEKAERDWSQQKRGAESLGKGSKCSYLLFLPHLI